MHLLSDISRDARHPKSRPGSYEWWYFDGISEDGDYQVVIIFYEGCPFSTRYIRSLEADPDSGDAQAERHPAISISLYHKGEPVFYSLSEYPPESCTFDEERAVVTVGQNSLRYSDRETHGSDGFASFDLRINERLPSGDELKGIITFSGLAPNERLFMGEGHGPGRAAEKSKRPGGTEASKSDSAATSYDHLWNLVLPRAVMHCRINLIRNGLITKDLIFEGTGYHDHNVGSEPMKESFLDWYWGRVHFPHATLVYYVMNKNVKNDKKKRVQDYRAWLLSPDNRRLLHTLELTRMRKKKANGFFLRPARSLSFRDHELEIEVRHRKLSDSGPFYCRYISSARLTHPALETVTTEGKESGTAEGIAEYIRPHRIHRRLFWPLVHMRLRYVDQRPHWVQKSPRLFRWTW